MSDKVTQLYPERARRRKIVRAIVSMLVVVLLAAGATAVILFRQELNLDKLRRYVTYLNVKDSGTYGKYTFDEHSGNAFAAFGDGLALASVGGLDAYDSSGKTLWSVSAAMDVPSVSVGDGTALAWDVGGTSLNLVSLKKGVLLKTSTDKMLLDADISNGNAVCYATSADGYKTLLTVLDSRQKETYHWYSSSQYLPLCAVSDDGTSVAAVGLGKKDASFESTGILLRTDQDKPTGTVSLGSQLFLDLDFLADGKLCAVGEKSARFFGADGKDLGTYDYADGYLRGFDFGGDGFLTLSLNMNKAGSRYTVATVNPDGGERARKEIDEEILSVSANGSYVAVLTASGLTIFTPDLKTYAETKDVSGASKVLMRKDGTAILVGSGEAHLYLP